MCVGRLEVIVGSMFCGKTEELIRLVRRAKIAKQQVQVFKPAIDNRYSTEQVAAHNGSRIEATPVVTAHEILALLNPDTTVVAIDEGQFFDGSIIDVIQELIDLGIRVILAGLDTDFRGEPFGVIPALMAEAEDVDKLHAICMVCGQPASRTQRLVNGKPANWNDPIIMVGASESYEARCREHHEVPGKPTG